MEQELELYIQKLISISNNKYKLLQEFLIETKKQSEFLSEDNIDKVLETLSKKQILIDSINKLDIEFNNDFEKLKKIQKVENLSDMIDKYRNIDCSKELKSIVEKILNILKNIDIIDKELNEKAKDMLNNLQFEIKKINSGKISRAAYAPNNIETPSYYIDKKK